MGETGPDIYIEVLDGSRIHPEHYSWARKMAVDALCGDDDEVSCKFQSNFKKPLFEQSSKLNFRTIKTKLTRQRQLSKCSKTQLCCVI